MHIITRYYNPIWGKNNFCLKRFTILKYSSSFQIVGGSQGAAIIDKPQPEPEDFSEEPSNEIDKERAKELWKSFLQQLFERLELTVEKSLASAKSLGDKVTNAFNEITSKIGWLEDQLQIAMEKKDEIVEALAEKEKLDEVTVVAADSDS